MIMDLRKEGNGQALGSELDQNTKLVLDTTGQIKEQMGITVLDLKTKTESLEEKTKLAQAEEKDLKKDHEKLMEESAELSASQESAWDAIAVLEMRQKKQIFASGEFQKNHKKI